MKKINYSTVKTVAVLALAVFCTLMAVQVNRLKRDLQTWQTKRAETVHDTTFVMPQPDTVSIVRWRIHRDTLALENVVYDTVRDSVYVETLLPITRKDFSDSVVTDSFRTHWRASVSGFDPSLDNVSIRTEITPQEPEKRPWWKGFGPAVGVGFGTGGFGVFVGAGYTFN